MFHDIQAVIEAWKKRNPFYEQIPRMALYAVFFRTGTFPSL